ncbi:hypothetical protein [Nesterenkonia sp. K-15-9-6]|uniref:hypothetical protein n=1 Tax=Nesterenkonia sp. K-15-9-6 TaxID=3093918 RepID=UPI00404519D1
MPQHEVSTYEQHTEQTRRWVRCVESLTAAGAVVALAAACGGDDADAEADAEGDVEVADEADDGGVEEVEDDGAAAESDDAEDGAEDVDVCGLITAEEISGIFGVEFAEGETNDDGMIPGECHWETDDGAALFIGVLTEDSSVARTPEAAFEQTLEAVEEQYEAADQEDQILELDLGEQGAHFPGGLKVLDDGGTVYLEFRAMGLDEQWDAAPEAAETVLGAL